MFSLCLYNPRFYHPLEIEMTPNLLKWSYKSPSNTLKDFTALILKLKIPVTPLWTLQTRAGIGWFRTHTWTVELTLQDICINGGHSAILQCFVCASREKHPSWHGIMHWDDQELPKEPTQNVPRHLLKSECVFLVFQLVQDFTIDLPLKSYYQEFSFPWEVSMRSKATVKAPQVFSLDCQKVKPRDSEGSFPMHLFLTAPVSGSSKASQVSEEWQLQSPGKRSRNTHSTLNIQKKDSESIHSCEQKLNILTKSNVV